ncbi:hypothetical protein AMATHDRAFT_69087 [Amanita thiersii Skay4041]|uniref:Uncharacterized protein n=1 Tax=Amanita thiersii Skay4041 TaxID=703135 RepID=A0A2A9NES9_9AGAR|nr:hypothetical protein AMATHDRAFT_69087 [Amanita thiersii Skay4041]
MPRNEMVTPLDLNTEKARGMSLRRFNDGFNEHEDGEFADNVTEILHDMYEDTMHYAVREGTSTWSPECPSLDYLSPYQDSPVSMHHVLTPPSAKSPKGIIGRFLRQSMRSPTPTPRTNSPHAGKSSRHSKSQITRPKPKPIVVPPPLTLEELGKVNANYMKTPILPETRAPTFGEVQPAWSPDVVYYKPFHGRSQSVRVQSAISKFAALEQVPIRSSSLRVPRTACITSASEPFYEVQRRFPPLSGHSALDSRSSLSLSTSGSDITGFMTPSSELGPDNRRHWVCDGSGSFRMPADWMEQVQIEEEDALAEEKMDNRDRKQKLKEKCTLDCDVANPSSTIPHEGGLYLTISESPATGDEVTLQFIEDPYEGLEESGRP